MALTLAFDVYGTLIDTHGVVERLTALLESEQEAQAFSQAWRDKQLEYAFRRGLMQRYVNFNVCTRDALEYVRRARRSALGDADCEALMDVYRRLPAFADVPPGLDALRATGARLYAFSNGAIEVVEGLLRQAGIRDCFVDVVSVDEVKSFKPDPAVYRHLLKRAQADAEHAWLISSNPFDVIGAMSAGMRAAWVQRSPSACFDPWGIEPSATVASLAELTAAIRD